MSRRRWIARFPARSSPSEFVPQRKLQYARLCQQTGVGAEGLWQRLQRVGARSRLHIESVQIRDVKDFTAELQRMAFPQLPALGQAHIPAGIARSTQCVACAALARIGVIET